MSLKSGFSSHFRQRPLGLTLHLHFSSQVQYGGDGGRQYYPTVDPALLEPEARYRRVVDTIETSQADVVCLQGVFDRFEKCAGESKLDIGRAY